MKKMILALDFGSSGVKATIFDENSNIIASKYKEYKTYYPKPNYALQSPEDWWNSFCSALKELFISSEVKPEDIACIAPSAQMSTAIPVSRNGKILVDPCWIWADMRSSNQVERITEHFGGKERFYGITGGGMTEETYTGFKIAWIKENMPEIYDNTYKFLQVKEYIGWRLTGEMATDFTDASECAMMDIQKKDWSREILSEIGVEKDRLLPIRRSFELLGKVTKEASEKTGLVKGTPVCVGGGDVSIAAAGAGISEQGECYIYIGSGAWIGIYSDKPIMDYSSRMVNLCDISGRGYVPHQIGYCGGIAHKWLRDTINSIDALQGRLDYDTMDKYIEHSPEGANGLLFIPFLRGGGAPYHNINARGCFLGLDLGHNFYDMCRSVLEGTAYVLREMFEKLEKSSGIKMKKVILIGGGAKSNSWRQILANILNRTIICTTMTQEANTWGAAICAGLCSGLWEDIKSAQKLLSVTSTNYPDNKFINIYDEIFDTFKTSYKQMKPIYDKLGKVREMY